MSMMNFAEAVDKVIAENTEETTEKDNPLGPPRYNEENQNLIIGDVEWSNDDVERFVQARRLRIIKAYDKSVTEEEFVLLDPDRQANYLATLRDLEKQIHTNKKLKQDEQSSAARDNALAQILQQAVTTRRHEYNQSRQNAPQASQPTFDSTKLPPKTLIPGETDIGDLGETYEDYQARRALAGHQDPLSPEFSQLGGEE